MRAAVIRSAGDPIEVNDDVRHRDPGPQDVVVRIRAAGVCQTDISLGGGAFGQPFPVVLGHEGAGEVVAIGSGVHDVAVGDRVLISWVPPCGRCYFCVRGETYICSTRRRAADAASPQTANLTADGEPLAAGMGTATWAEESVVPANSLIGIPDDLPWALAALLGCAVPTGYGAAVNAANVGPGDTVLVIGCGPVGLSAVQGAVISGAATVVAVDPNERRRELALRLGATAAIAPDAALDRTRPAVGFDIAIDAVGNSGTIRSSWDAVRRGGTVVVVGAGKADDLVAFSALELFHAEKTLRGSFYGSTDMRHDVPLLIELWRAGRLDLDALVDDVVGLDRIDEAVSRQRDGSAVRVMLAP